MRYCRCPIKTYCPRAACREPEGHVTICGAWSSAPRAFFEGNGGHAVTVPVAEGVIHRGPGSRMLGR